MCFLKTALENTLTKDAFQQLPLGILFKLFKSHGWENDDCPVTTTRDEGLSCHGCPVTENVGKNVLSRLGGIVSGMRFFKTTCNESRVKSFGLGHEKNIKSLSVCS